MPTRNPLVITPISGLPLVKQGDDLAGILWEGLDKNGISLKDEDILVIAQKVVSKAEGRLVNLQEITPSEKANQLALVSGKDARYVELVLRESAELLRIRPGLLICQHRNGFVCANAGIDHSNVSTSNIASDDSSDGGWYLLLPENADQSAARLQQGLMIRSNQHIGVLITDSHGRAWRNGTVGISIGTSDVPELVNRIGDRDLFGYELKATIIAAADQLAAAAALVMGEAEEGIPAVHVRGFPYPLRQSSISEVIRPKEKDLFR
ncbi:MAG: coenzyme F420-0:L-glutamate ligase [Anaerolineae bacterium]|nr:coenzyme F420-0:L-glutamate ligase [Anaerolineae bacterium]